MRLRLVLLMLAMLSGATSEGSDPRTLPRHSTVITSVAFLDGDMLASGSGDEVRVWSIGRGDIVARLEGHSLSVLSLARLGPSATVSGDKAGKVIFWDWKSRRKKVVETARSEITSLAVSPDGTVVAAGAHDGSVHLLQAKTAQRLRSLSHGREGEDRSVFSVAFSTDGNAILSGGGAGRVKQWETATGRELETWELGNGLVLDLAWGDQRTFVAVLGLEREAKLLRWGTGEAPASKDLGDVLVTHHGGGVRAVALRSGIIQIVDDKGEVVLKVGERSSDLITSIAVAPDGKRVACGTSHGCLRVWDISDKAGSE